MFWIPKPEDFPNYSWGKCSFTVNPETTCPFCQNKYHKVESPFLGKKEIWEDCIKCGKTKETILEEYKQKDSNETSSEQN